MISNRMGHCKSQSKRVVYSSTSLPQKTNKQKNPSRKHSNLICKATRKRKTKPKVTRKKEIKQIRIEIEIETKKPKKRSIKLRAGTLKRQTKLISL